MSQRVPLETLSATVFMLSCGVAAGIVSFAQSAEQLTSEAMRSTSAGATFTAPAAWTIRSDGNKIVLTPPETGDFTRELGKAVGHQAHLARRDRSGFFPITSEENAMPQPASNRQQTIK